MMRTTSSWGNEGKKKEALEATFDFYLFNINLRVNFSSERSIFLNSDQWVDLEARFVQHRYEFLIHQRCCEIISGGERYSLDLVGNEVGNVSFGKIGSSAMILSSLASSSESVVIGICLRSFLNTSYYLIAFYIPLIIKEVPGKFEIPLKFRV